MFDKQLRAIEKELQAVVAADQQLQAKVANITSIKGVGLLTALTIIAETNGFELFQNQRQLVSYAGYDVVENQSGKRAGKTRISKKGNSHLRRCLFMPAFNMVRYECFQRAICTLASQRQNQDAGLCGFTEKAAGPHLYTLAKR